MAKTLDEMTPEEIQALHSSVFTPNAKQPQQTKSLDDMSPEEIAQLHSQHVGNAPEAINYTPEQIKAAQNDPNLKFTPPAMPDTEIPGVGTFVGMALEPVGTAVDYVAGAPVRQGISEAQKADGWIDSAVAGAKGFFGQYLKKPSTAATGKQIAIQAGLPDKPLSEIAPQYYSKTGNEPDKFKRGGIADFSSAGAGGLGVDIAADMTNIIPVAAAMKGFSKGAGKAASETASLARQAVKKVPYVGAASEISAETAKSMAKKFSQFVKPEIRAEYEARVATAIENGIDPEILPSSVKYKGGVDSSIARAERRMAQEVGGETQLAKHEQAHKAVRDAYDRQIQKVGGSPGLGEADSGQVLKEGYDVAKKEFFEGMDFTYDTVRSQLPKNAPLTAEANEKLVAHLKKIQRQASSDAKNTFLKTGEAAEKSALADRLDGLIRNLEAAQNPELVFDTTKPIVKKMSGILRSKTATAAQKKQAMQVMNDIGGFREAHKFGDFEAINDLRAQVGSALEKNSQMLGLDKKQLGELYGELSGALKDSTEGYLGKDVRASLEANNKAMTDWFKNAGQIEDVIQSGNPEDIYKMLVARGSTNDLRALKHVLKDKPEVLNQMKASFLEGMKRIDRNEGFSFERIGTALRNDEKVDRVLRELFSPQEITNIKKLVQLGEDFGPAKLNSSQTSEAFSFGNLMDSAKRHVENRALIDIVKNNADKLPPPGSTSLPVPSAGQQFLESIAERKFGLGRSPVQMGGKVAQVYTVSQYESQGDFVFVPETMRMEAMKKISDSDLTNVEKALAINKMNKSGEVSASLVDKIGGFI